MNARADPPIRICECCGAVIPPQRLELSPTQAKIYNFVAKRPDCNIDQIHEHLYYHRTDGGPEKATINTMICQLNKRLKGHRIKCTHPGWWATYRLVKLEDTTT